MDHNKLPQDPIPYPPPDASAHAEKPTPETMAQPQQFYNGQQEHSFTITQLPTVQHFVAGPSPSNITCPSCQKVVVTRMEYEASSKTHWWACILCCFV